MCIHIYIYIYITGCIYIYIYASVANRGDHRKAREEAPGEALVPDQVGPLL